MKRFLLMPALCAAVSMGVMMPCGAVTLDWDDLTNAQQEQAYRDLESENESLKQQIQALQEQLGVSDTSTDGDTSSGSADGDAADTSAGTDTTASSAAAQEAQASAVRDVDTFLSDIAASFDARQELARTYTNEEVSAMSTEDMWAFRFKCAEAERSFYETYASAQFNDLNILYLCSEYCQGLEKQYEAEEIWNSSQDADTANEKYTAGYYNRAYALVELCEFYDLDLADEYANLKNAVAQMDALSGDETRNATVDSATVMTVQELLNEVGFRCGTPDGIAGRQTASSIERFQKMYGFEPADGIIDDELIEDLNQILAQQQG